MTIQLAAQFSHIFLHGFQFPGLTKFLGVKCFQGFDVYLFTNRSLSVLRDLFIDSSGFHRVSVSLVLDLLYIV